MKKAHYISAFAAIITFSSPAMSYAQEGLMAFHDENHKQLESVDDEIRKAAKSLDETKEVLEGSAQTEAITVDDLIDSATVEETAKQSTSKSQASRAENEATSEFAAHVALNQSAEKLDLRVDFIESDHPTKAEEIEIAAKQEAETTIEPVVEPEPNKAEETEIAANTVVETTVASKPKHDLQAAPAKVVSTQSKAIAKTEKHDIQSSPAKSSVSGTHAIASAQKHHSQTAPSKSVIQTTSKSQAGQKAPALHPQKSTHSLSMDYVMANYRANDVDLSKAATDQKKPTIGQLYQYAFSQKLVYQSTRPAVGDLVFFHNTVDRNGDGQWNDWHTLVGIVESADIDGNQTISVLTWRTDKIERIHLNLKYPELYKSRKGKLLNSQLRPDQDENKGTAAKLFAGFANLLGNKTTFNVIDNWRPGMK